MPDFERDPFRILNVPRNAGPDELDAAFAKRYKEARRVPDAEARQQALNEALETLREPDARAAAEVEAWLLPLADDARVPELPELLDVLLPCRPDEPFDPREAVAGPSVADAAQSVIDDLPTSPEPDRRELVRRLAARLAIEMIDPWSEADE